jgi:hypothetical protein
METREIVFCISVCISLLYYGLCIRREKHKQKEDCCVDCKDYGFYIPLQQMKLSQILVKLQACNRTRIFIATLQDTAPVSAVPLA